MPAIIVTILAWFSRYAVLKVLLYLGIGIGSYAIIQLFFDKYVNAALMQMGGLPSDLMYLVGISKIDKAISIVIGAMMVRAFIVSMRTMIAKI